MEVVEVAVAATVEVEKEGVSVVGTVELLVVVIQVVLAVVVGGRAAAWAKEEQAMAGGVEGAEGEGVRRESSRWGLRF